MIKGSWVDCTLNKSHKGVKVKYFREWDRNYNFCDLCLDAIQKENKTGKYAVSIIPLPLPKEQCKPEKDSL